MFSYLKIKSVVVLLPRASAHPPILYVPTPLSRYRKEHLNVHASVRHRCTFIPLSAFVELVMRVFEGRVIQLKSCYESV